MSEARHVPTTDIRIDDRGSDRVLPVEIPTHATTSSGVVDEQHTASEQRYHRTSAENACLSVSIRRRINRRRDEKLTLESVGRIRLDH